MGSPNSDRVTAEAGDATGQAGDHAGFRGDIEGLRALAIVVVVMFHAGVPGVDGGFVGVDVFFVISGFLITRLLLRGAEGGGGVGFGEFYARRVRRLLPAATVVIVATLAMAAVKPNPVLDPGYPDDARAAALFYSNLWFESESTDYFAEDTPPSPYQQFWSLSVEEQFYLVWPALFLLLLLMGRRSRPRGGEGSFVVAGGLAVLTLASFAYSLSMSGSDPGTAFFRTPVRAWELGLGALSAVLVPVVARWSIPARDLLIVSGLASIVWSATAFDEATHWPGTAALAPTLGTALVILAGTATLPSRASRWLGVAPLRWLGRYSYSLYLWHWPVIVLAHRATIRVEESWALTVAAVGAVAVPVSLLQYHFIENPIRRSAWFRARPARFSLALGFILIGISLLAAWFFPLFVQTETDSGRPAEIRAEAGGPLVPTDHVPSDLRPAIDVPREEARFEWICSNGQRFCPAGDSSGAPSIALWGDSHLQHLLPAFLGASVDGVTPAYKTYVVLGCSSFFIDNGPGCDVLRTEAIDQLHADPPEIVVMSNDTEREWQQDPVGWEVAIRDSIRSVPDATQVFVLAQTPRHSMTSPGCLARNLQDTTPCDQEWDHDMNEHLAGIVTEEGARFVDLQDWLCVDGRCPAITGDVRIYADTNHFTSDFAELLVPQVDDLLVEVVDG